MGLKKMEKNLRKKWYKLFFKNIDGEISKNSF